MSISREKGWYLKRTMAEGAKAFGAFSNSEVQDFLLNGRFLPREFATLDGVFWEPIHQVPELIPESMLPDFGRVVG